MEPFVHRAHRRATVHLVALPAIVIPQPGVPTLGDEILRELDVPKTIAEVERREALAVLGVERSVAAHEVLGHLLVTVLPTR